MLDYVIKYIYVPVGVKIPSQRDMMELNMSTDDRSYLYIYINIFLYI